ncbi:hypothetical protein H0H93_000774 [Arthromyces matolae]|nr:hypothetical protein H0H93_000774 [Arthromyces matolae]
MFKTWGDTFLTFHILTLTSVSNRRPSPFTACLAATITVYGVSPVGYTPDLEPVSPAVSVQAVGTGKDGMTTYVEQDIISTYVQLLHMPSSTFTTTVALSTPSTELKTFAEDATHYVFHKDPIPTGTAHDDKAGVNAECFFDGKGGASCVSEAWQVEATATYSNDPVTFTGSALPLYTVVVSDTASPPKPNSSAPGGKIGYVTFVFGETVTFYTETIPGLAPKFEVLPTSLSVQAIGTGSDGMTTYVEEYIASEGINRLPVWTTSGSVVTVVASTTSTSTGPLITPVTDTGMIELSLSRNLISTLLLTVTFAEDATHYVYDKTPNPTGTRNTDDWYGQHLECNFDGGVASCIEEIWAVEPTKTISTSTYTIVGSATPWYTLAVSNDETATATKGNSAPPGISTLGKESCVAWGLFAIGTLATWAWIL